ncbi:MULTISPECIES: hypothetical protein [Pseudoxanthomonas]|jgi:hypothetical protein|uniref:hypothetical protein n=1 Tax=Pseudoxanthomonas TaxID=83618 RepID=UPI00161EFA1F|nr:MULTISPECIES: hypothetical protein [Pseudoxanthomonas]MBB3276929.1 hypothetical protein [Pseudoxanthomonas sp. OG2]MBD9376759.1 hypothetical protein [Pseudoxanthomonas sp. PXM04]MBV7475779.1 hypothetical protein [Pseudoxanthomonas sp. PXM05]UBB26717.1 hypothetical protein LAG73_06460 [Pseudoxanthomonas japonensis]
MLLFFALCFVGVAIAGFCAFVIFWPLTLVHIRDRHAALGGQWGEGAFLKPIALRWLLARGYLPLRDSSLSGLAAPARISLLVIFVALVSSGLLTVFSLVLK